MFLLKFSLILSMLFIFMNHPMSMGLILLLQTITISMLTGFINMNYWFSYILFLIMIGGMLILFIYMTSITSNEKFINYYSMQMMMIYFLMTMLIIFIMYEQFNINLMFNYMDQLNTQPLLYQMILLKFFNFPTLYIILFIMIYLFITLIAIVKITKIESGPLRQLS